MPRYNLQQQYAFSCGAAASAVAIAELSGTPGLASNAQETFIYRDISRNFPNLPSAPARIVRHFRARGFRASIVESPYRSAVLMATQPARLIPEWLRYSGELWSRWVWRWPRGLRARDFDNDARVLMVCVVAGGLHYLLARREMGVYWIMDPADSVDYMVGNFGQFAAFWWFDGPSWNPNNPFFTMRNNWYTGISVWVQNANAPYVWF